MSTNRSTTLLTALPMAALAFGTGFAEQAPTPQAVPAAHAQSNPCAPAARNPCAPAAHNPCAPAANPCAPAAKGDMAKDTADTKAMAKAHGGHGQMYPQAVHGPAANPFDVAAGHTQAPYGDAMPAIVENYLRAAPYIGTGGSIDMESFDKLKELGFKTIVSLVTTTDEEGTEVMEKGEAAGLDVVNIGVSTRAPTPRQVGRFAEVANDPDNYPILVHCHSSNRSGAMWALYRAMNGVPPRLAIQEGRTVGLKPSREHAVRDQLGLPPMDEE